jgi:AI-2 transport protein TqsA
VSTAVQRTDGTAAHVLKVAAAVVLVAAGLKVAAPLLLPIVAAGFLALVALPALERLEGWGVPKGLAILLTVLAALVSLAVFTSLLTTTLAEFGSDLPKLREQIDGRMQELAATARDLGWKSSAEAVEKRFNPGPLLDLLTQAVSGILDLFSSFVVILLLTVFALVEAEDLPAKLRSAMRDPNADLSIYRRMAKGVSTYAFWKTVMNALTGVLVTLACWLMGVRHPLLWGLIAFLFNFVPSIGSFIVAVPIVLLTWAERGAGTAILMAIVQVGIGQLVGSVLEPLVMGRRMGLSPLVILLSLLIWGWLWGPVGMLLSVPLTMILRTLLLETKDGRPLGVLLGPRCEADEPA